MIPADHLRRLRNEIPLRSVLDRLAIPAKWSEGYLRFLCPLCNEGRTAVNPRTNLGRCFRCERNYNAVDLFIIVGKLSFLEAVEHLEELLPAE